jgi:dephospho-CoA kinase
MESAIIFEYGFEKNFDMIIVADAPLELRIKRILLRNPNLTRDDVLKRMSCQISQEEKCSRADLVMCTGETYEESLKLR